MDRPNIPRFNVGGPSGAGPDSWEGDPLPHEPGASPEEIEECLRLLDEVWPHEEPSSGEIPRELGRFRILSELGRGGFGVVFLAEDSMLGRRVAVKVPRVEVLSGSDSWRRFLREARAASRLDHPNLVPLLDVGAVGPVGYIVSAYVPGPSLEEWLKGRRRAVDPRWSARLVTTLARAVGHVHTQQILHRDLKPANVLLHAPGRTLDPADPSGWADVDDGAWIPRICDFGLAKLREIEEEETRSRMACGSPPYMAPEQAESRGDEIGPATDVYGLGAILYELLTGRPPFGGEGQLETLRRVVSDEPVPPRRRRSGIPRDLETICLKCLAKRPQRRYADAHALADDLERMLEGRPIAARPTPAWERAGRWARRNPTVAAMAMVMVLSVAAGLCGLFWHNAVLREKNEELRREVLRAERHAREAEQQRNLAVRQRTGAELFQAHLAVSSDRYERARRLLAATAGAFGPPRAETFPWRFIREAVRDHIEVLEGHGGMVESLAIAPDGRRLASGDDRGEVRIWDLDTGKGRVAQDGPGEAVGRLAWSPDGVSLAAAGRPSGKIAILDVDTGRCRGSLQGTGAGEAVWRLAFEGRGLLAIGPRNDPDAPAVRLWDLSPGSGPFREVAVVADDSGADDRLRTLVDLLEGETSSVVGRRAGGRGVLFTRDRALGVMAVGDSTFAVIRGKSWIRLATVHFGPGGRRFVPIDPKGDRDDSSPEEASRLKRLAVGTRGAPILAGVEKWTSVSDPDGGEIAVWHEGFKRLGLVSLASGEERRVTELGPLNGVQSMAVGPDGATLAVGGEDHRIRLWHRKPKRRTIAIDGHAPHEAWAVAFSPDGRTLATAGDDHLVRLWDAETGRATRTLRRHHSLVTCLAFSPDGRTLASGSFDRKAPIVLWDVDSGRPRLVVDGPRDRVRTLAFSPDGKILASSGDAAAIFLHDPSDGRRIAAIPGDHTPGPGCLSFRDDGRVLAAAQLSSLILIDTETRRLQSASVGEKICWPLFSRDGSVMFFGTPDGSILARDGDGQTVWRVQAHAGLVLRLALSPDGAVLASASEDGTVRLWDVLTGQELLSLTDCRARVNSVAFSPDGMSLAAADHSGAVTIWTARPTR